MQTLPKVVLNQVSKHIHLPKLVKALNWTLTQVNISLQYFITCESKRKYFNFENFHFSFTWLMFKATLYHLWVYTKTLQIWKLSLYIYLLIFQATLLKLCQVMIWWRSNYTRQIIFQVHPPGASSKQNISRGNFFWNPWSAQ